eukprot:112081-Pleurochrysis_carterae.AAC.1
MPSTSLHSWCQHVLAASRLRRSRAAAVCAVCVAGAQCRMVWRSISRAAAAALSSPRSYATASVRGVCRPSISCVQHGASRRASTAASSHAGFGSSRLQLLTGVAESARICGLRTGGNGL